MILRRFKKVRRFSKPYLEKLLNAADWGFMHNGTRWLLNWSPMNLWSSSGEKKNKSTSESAKIEKQNINIVDNAITELICVDVENEQNSRDRSTFWLAKMCTKYSDTSYIECIIQEKISDLLKKPNLASHWCPRRFNKNDHYFMVLIDYTIKTENTLNGNKQGS